MKRVHTWDPSDRVITFATSPDSRLLVAGCEDGRVRVHNCVAPPYELLCETTEGEKCESIHALAVCTAPHNDSDLIVVTGHRGWMVRCWRVDVAARQFRLEWVGDGVREEKEHDDRSCCFATTVCISHDRQWVAVGGYNYRQGDGEEDDICLFSLHADGALHRPARVFMSHENTPWGLCFSPDDRVLVSGSFDETLRVWSVESGEQLQCVKVKGGMRCMAACSKQLVTSHYDGTVGVWQLDVTGDHYAIIGESMLRYFIGDYAFVSTLCCTQGGGHAIITEGEQDPTVQIWNLASGKRVAKFEGHTESVLGVGVTSTGNIVSCSTDWTVRLWCLESVDVRRAIAPVHTLLEEEWRALRCTRASTSPGTAAIVMFGILLDAAARRLWIRTNGC